MRWIHFLTVLQSLAALNGAEPFGYYNAAAGLTGTALRTALHNIIDDHTSVSYSAAENALKVTDEDRKAQLAKME